ARHLGRICQTIAPTGSRLARCSPSRLHKTRESNLQAPCSSCENENRLARSRQNQRRSTSLPRGKSSKLASDSSSQACARRLPLVRADVDAATLLRPKLRDKAKPE